MDNTTMNHNMGQLKKLFSSKTWNVLRIHMPIIHVQSWELILVQILPSQATQLHQENLLKDKKITLHLLILVVEIPVDKMLRIAGYVTHRPNSLVGTKKSRYHLLVQVRHARSLFFHLDWAKSKPRCKKYEGFFGNQGYFWAINQYSITLIGVKKERKGFLDVLLVPTNDKNQVIVNSRPNIGSYCRKWVKITF